MKQATQERTEMDDIVDVAPTDNLPAVHGANGYPYRESAPTPSLPTTGFANIATAISAVMAEIGVVGEGGENKFQNYKYMSYKDMFRKLTPLMGKHGLAVIPTEKSKNLFDNDAVVMGTYQFTIIHKSGEVWPFQPEWTGVSRARDSKGGFDDKALNKCATAAQKYFLKALFQIPSGEDDEDPDNHDGHVPGAPRPRGRAPVPSPSQAGTARNVNPEPPQAPHKIVGGSYAGWATAYTEAIGKAGDAATVMAWIDANQQMLAKLEKGSPSDAANVKSFTEKHLAFLHRTAPKSDPISTGVPTKSKDAMPNIEKNYTGWIEWAVKKIAVTDAGDDMDALFESFDPFWDDLMPPDKDALLNTRRGREATQEP